MARFRFLSWRIFISSVGAFSFPQLVKTPAVGIKKSGRQASYPPGKKLCLYFLEFISYVEKQGNVVSLCVVCNMQEAVAGVKSNKESV